MKFSRNLGLISQDQQQKLSDATVLVCGVGGMGGVCAEVLVRMGVGSLILADPDIFEEVNLNRQIHSNRNTIGKLKVEVLKEQFLQINSDLKVKAYSEKVSRLNTEKLLVGADIVVNGMDQMDASISIERAARRKKLPIVDAWITPFASVFTMTKDDPHWETFLDLPTRGKAEEEITEADCKLAMEKEVKYTLSHFNPHDYIQEGVVVDVLAGKKSRPSLAPVVWLSGVLMANEVFKIIVGYKPVGPSGIFYNQYTHSLMSGKRGC